MKWILALLLAAAMTLPARGGDEAVTKTIYDFTMKNIDGQSVSLGTYSGQVVMIVNVASRCGFTPQYEGLEKIYQQYKDQGFVILGFPANNFLGQEPGTEAQIKSFCSLTYGVTFPMFAKISVNGDDIHHLYAFLTSDAKHGGAISWNFNKFLIGRNGAIVNRFGTRTKPESDEVKSAIEAALRTPVP